MLERKLGIIILNYNGLTDTINLLESIWKSVHTIEYSVIIVDNASDNCEADYLETTYGNRITLLRSMMNSGYAAGNNLGIRYAVKSGFNYLCILNNDTIITDDFFADCVNYLDNHPNVAFISPAVIGENNKIQSLGGTYSPIKGNTYFNHCGEDYNQADGREIICDLVFGACMIFKASLLDYIGYIPEVYFLFYEETEWCLRAQMQGRKNICLSNHYILHKGSVSIKRIHGLSEYLLERNRVVFAKRNLRKFEFYSFLIFDFFRLIYHRFRYQTPFIRYLKYRVDGLTGKIDERYQFIWINKDD